MSTLSLDAPAKVNLFLEVCGRDQAGYHLLETIFLAVDLADRIDLTVGPPGIAMTCGGDPSCLGETPADERNLAWRAAAAYYAAIGQTPAITIHLEKRIPVAGGLGGGSSDAAAVLRGLQKLHGAALSADALHAVAAELGADVPFFLSGGCAYADGRGDRIHPLADLPDLPLTIVRPPCACPTGAIFAALDDRERHGQPLGRAALEARLRRDPASLLFNRLEAVARRLHPPVDAALAHLAAAGHAACLSGSGSCCLVLGHVDPPPGCRAWRVMGQGALSR